MTDRHRVSGREQDELSVIQELQGIWEERQAFFQALLKVAWARDIDEARTIARQTLAAVARSGERGGAYSRGT